MAPRQNGAYISQLVHKDLESAAPVLDAVYRGLPTAGVGSRFVRVCERFWLSADGLHTDPDPGVVRGVRGVLWLGCWPVRVVVELVEWSSSACEIAVRPLSYTWPVWTERYARAAADRVRRLAGTLEVSGNPGLSQAPVTTGAPFLLINGWNTAGSSDGRSDPDRRQWSDAATAAAESLA